MKEIITNKNNLKEEEITEVVKRVKALLINDSNEILLGYSHNTYQFPGGHVEDNETLDDTLKREIKEETGIELKDLTYTPFLCSKGYYKDWPNEGLNRKTEIYYYIIRTNEMPNLLNIKLTEHEKDGNFRLDYISLENVEEEIAKNAEKHGDKYSIAREMLEIFKIYKEKI